MSKKTAKIRKIAKDVVYVSPDENPFKEDTQFYKAYKKFKIHYDSMEVTLKDLEEIYGWNTK
jgi:hypothetical protein